MHDETEKRDRFDWRFPIYAAVGALILYVPFILYGFDIAQILYILVAAPIIGFVLLIVALRKKGLRRLAVLSSLVIYGAVSWGLFIHSLELRTTARWLLWSRKYKAEVLAQPVPANGTLRHTEWDGWGFPGAGDTTVYLVFDPNDSLAAAARSHAPGKFSGMPCEVAGVRRLESHYYSVLFYTPTDWDHCN